MSPVRIFYFQPTIVLTGILKVGLCWTRLVVCFAEALTLKICIMRHVQRVCTTLAINLMDSNT